MKKFLYLCVFSAINFIVCQTKGDKENESVLPAQKPHYISIEGLWRCTPETARRFPNGRLEAVVKIGQDMAGKWTSRGFYLWDGHYRDEWDLVKIEFNDTTNQVTIFDGEGSTFIGRADLEKQIIRGTVFSGYPDFPVPEDKLDLIRADHRLAAMVLHPRFRDETGGIPYLYHRPEQLKDGLNTASVFDFAVDSSNVNLLISQIIRQKFGRLESLLIIKDQKLILEEYFFGYDRTQPHHIHSCTKSITSLLLGIALRRRKTVGINQCIFNFFPNYDSLRTKEKENLTLKHVLTMTAGFQEQEEYEDIKVENPLSYILGLPLEALPGEKFRYSNDCSNLLGGIIYSITGEFADSYSKKVLFGPLGISHSEWEIVNGIPYCHSGMKMLPRDMAKIGLLVLNNGKWRGRQIVPEEWIRESTEPHVAESQSFDYGYQWWHISSRNKSWWEKSKDSEKRYDMVIALGYAGQFIMVIRDLNLVVVTTASDYADFHTALEKIPMVIEKVIPLFGSSK
ncbi:serine hydrolase [candidate division KSB1 bacterium]|nr:serine hydrolase [candidate division KSB1 bacterium]